MTFGGVAEPMSTMELDEVRRWAEQRGNPDDGGTTVGETYLRLLATIAARDATITEIGANAKRFRSSMYALESTVTERNEEIARLRASIAEEASEMESQADVDEGNGGKGTIADVAGA